MSDDACRWTPVDVGWVTSCGALATTADLDAPCESCWRPVEIAPDPHIELKGENARLKRHLARVTTALADLVRINEEHNESMSRIIKRPMNWKDTYLDAARAALAKARGEP